MSEPRYTKQQSDFEDAILDLIDNRDDYTRSDLQGAVSAIVLRIQGQHEALRIVSEGINGAIDNWAHWTDEYKQQHLIGLQTVAMDAHKNANAGKVQP